MHAPQPWPAPTASGPLDATVHLPGSKSLTARALLLAAVASRPTTVTGVLRSRDTDLMIAALTTLGARIEEVASPTRLRVTPAPLPLPVSRAAPGAAARIDCGLAGTVMRFIPPLVALADGPVALDGDPAARLRPLGPLLDAVAGLGVEVTYRGRPGHLPVLLTPAAPTGGTGPVPRRLAVDSSASSQFLSALLLAAPLLPGGAAMTPTGAVPSLPHVNMTVACLRERGIDVVEPAPGAPEGQRTWTVLPGRPSGGTAQIEPDLSNAGPFLAAALVTGGTVRVGHWPAATTQAGRAWRDLLPRLGGATHLVREQDGSLTLTSTGTGRLRGIDADLSAVGELVPTVAAIAALAAAQGHASHLYGIGHLRGHETDRLAALEEQINTMGGRATATATALRIEPAPLAPTTLRSYADHRMATFAALIGLGVAGTRLDDIGCTSKTLPGFPSLWEDMLSTAVPGAKER